MRKTFYIIATLILATSVLAEVSWEIMPERTNVVSKNRTQLKLTATWSGYETLSVRTPRFKDLKGALVQDVVSFNESKPGEGGVKHTATFLFDLLVTNAPGSAVELGTIEVMSRGPMDSEYAVSSLEGPSLNVRSARTKWFIAAGALLLALASLPFFLRKKLFRAKKEALPEKSLEDELLLELEECKSLKLKGETAAYFGKCESLIRSYLRAKYSVADLDSFSEKEAQENGVDHRMIRTAKELCALAFNVRYANYEPSSQEEKRIYDYLRELLIRNRPNRQRETDELYLKQEKI